jgi:hypothetical protein
VVGNLLRDAKTKLQAQIAPADLLLSDTVEAVQVIEETFIPSTGEPGKTLVLKMQVEFSARYVLDEDLRQLSLSALNASAENGFEAVTLPTYKVVADPSTDSFGVSYFDIEVSRSLLRQVDELQVFSLVRGGNPEAIKGKLKSALSLRQTPEISLSPSWWRWLPLVPFNISVVVK